MRRSRDAISRGNRSDALHLSEVRTHLQIRDVAVDFRRRREGFVPDAIRQREPREHVPVIGGVADEAPVAEIRAGISELNFCICRIAEKKIRKIVSDAGHRRDWLRRNWPAKRPELPAEVNWLVINPVNENWPFGVGSVSRLMSIFANFAADADRVFRLHPPDAVHITIRLAAVQ